MYIISQLDWSLHMKKRPITIRDLALKLNLSISTISRALRGVSDINPDTKKAVLDLAKELNYQPNHIAQSLRSKHTFTIGIIVPELVMHFFSLAINGIQNITTPEGYNIIICPSNERYEEEIKSVNSLIAHRVDGIIASLSRQTKNLSHFNAAQERGIPVVLFDRVSTDNEGAENFCKVMVDDYKGAFEAVDHLIKIGRTKIAHVSGPKHLLIVMNRLKGYKAALEKNNIPYDEKYVIHCSDMKDDTTPAVNKLLDLPNPPDAIFAINDPIAIKSLQVIKGRGLSIPKDIALVGFTDEPIAQIVEPSLSTVHLPVFDMGAKAARLLIDRIDTNDLPAESAILSTHLLIRDSTIGRN